MFTGLVETTGRIQRIINGSLRCLWISSSLDLKHVAIGDSIAIDGCCLTVVEVDCAQKSLAFHAATETLQRTTLGQLKLDDHVNLEAALRLGDRLGGHLVSGHIDGVGCVSVCQQRDSALYLGVDVPPEVASLSVARGSITLSGVSLTITDVQDNTIFVALIPHTLAATTLDKAVVGTRLNVEADMLGRYVAKLLAERQNISDAGSTTSALTVDMLRDKGFA